MKIRVWVHTNKNGSECEDAFDVDDAEWETMTEAERDDMAKEIVWNMAEWGYNAEPEDGPATEDQQGDRDGL